MWLNMLHTIGLTNLTDEQVRIYERRTADVVKDHPNGQLIRSEIHLSVYSLSFFMVAAIELFALVVLTVLFPSNIRYEYVSSHIFIPIICGLIGGLLQCILVEGDFLKQRRRTSNNGDVLLSHWFYTKLCSGITISLIIWELGAYELSRPRILAMCLLAGFGGSNLIASIIQKKSLDTESDKVNITYDLCTRLIKVMQEGMND